MPSLMVNLTPPTFSCRLVAGFRRMWPVPYSTLRLASGFSGTITRSASMPVRTTPIGGASPFGS
jgi:hypothetical protein